MAVNFLSAALELERQLPPRAVGAVGGVVVAPAVRARWQRELGQAYWGLGRLPESRKALDAAVASVVHPVPLCRAGLGASLAPQLARQVAHPAFDPRPVLLLHEPRLAADLLPGLEIDEPRFVAIIERALEVVQHVEHDDFVLAVPEVLEPLHHGVGIVEQVRDDDAQTCL